MEHKDVSMGSIDEGLGEESPTEPVNDIVRVPDSQIYFNPLGVLGTSGSSIVYKGHFRERKWCAAVKRINKDHYKLYKNELEIWGKINSENSTETVNIVQLLDYVEDASANAYYFAMELANATLHKRVKDDGIGYEKSVGFIQNASNGLKWLHNRPQAIIHRDVKPENILIFQCASGLEIAKLADFGISRELKKEHVSATLTKYNGTEFWMAPEAIEAMHEDKGFPNKKSLDIFSLGATAYYAVAKGIHPFKWSSFFKNDIVSNIKWIDIVPMPLPEQSKMVAADNLVRWMMQKHKPENRPDINEILLHPFFWDWKKSLDFFVDISNATMNEGEMQDEWNIVWRAVDLAYLKYSKNNKKLKFNWIPQEALQFIVTTPNKSSSVNQRTESVEMDGDDHLLQPSSTVYALLFKRLDGRTSSLKGSSLRSLVKFIRDKYQHYKALDPQLEVDECFGNLENGLKFDREKYINYFLDKYPDILTILFCVLANQRGRGCMALIRETYFKEMKGECHWGDAMMEEIHSLCGYWSRLRQVV